MNQIEPEPERLSLIARAMTATRLLFAGGLVAVFVFSALPTQASTLWRMDDFSTHITVSENGVLFVEEEVEAFFLQPRHGIFRYIPYKGTTTDGEKYEIHIRLLGVTDQSGVKQNVSESRSGDNVVWKIGDAKQTLTGRKTYLISYEVRDAILRYEDRDELFWNVSGFGWDVPLPALQAIVEFPLVDEAASEIRCFTGSYGSTAEECVSVKGPSFAGFTTENLGDPMSIAVSWPKGHIGEESFFIRIALFLAKFWHFSIPLLVFIFYGAAWKEYGDDDTGYAVVPEYDAPKELRPAQLNALLSQNSVTKDISPTIIDLAVRGYITITETKTKGVILTTTDYLLTKTGKETSELQKFEKNLLSNMFGAKDEIKVSELKNTFYKHLSEFTDDVMHSLVEKKLFVERPMKTRIAWILPGIGVLFFMFFSMRAVQSGLFWVVTPGIFLLISLLLLQKYYTKKGNSKNPKGVMSIIVFVLYLLFSFGNLGRVMLGTAIEPFTIASFVIASIIIIGFGWAMPKWTHAGAASVRHGKGFKMFISKVKKYRTEWEEKENIFETVLPYALVFGLGKKWASAFEGLQQQPPDWYRGASVGAWNPIAFESSLSSMTTSLSAAATSSPRSSGGSSGGFSGGGGGGGGGGSW